MPEDLPKPESTKSYPSDLAKRMNEATPEQIARAVERLPPDAREWAAEFESYGHWVLQSWDAGRDDYTAVVAGTITQQHQVGRVTVIDSMVIEEVSLISPDRYGTYQLSELIGDCLLVKYADGTEMWTQARDYRTNPALGSYVIRDRRHP